MWSYEAMSDTCNKNMTGTTEVVTLGVAMAKVLCGAWELARNVNTGTFISLNKTLLKVRGDTTNRFPDNLLVMVSDLASGPIYESFRFYEGDFSDCEWAPCDADVCYTLDPFDCLRAIQESDDFLAFEYKDSLGGVNYVFKKSLVTKGLPPGALETKWRKASLEDTAILL